MNPALAVLAIIGIIWFLYMENSNMSTTTPSPLANAIAKAEGFFTVKPDIPQTAANPGDLAEGDIGQGVANSAGVSVFASVEEGWAALEAKLQEWFSGSGTSRYNSDMTIQEFANMYVNGGTQTQGSVDWANNVASSLGVTTDTTIGEVYS